MDDLSARLSKLGKAVADVSDRAADPSTLARARARLLAGKARAPRRRPRLALGLAFAAAACALALVLFFARPEAPVSFEVGSPPAPGAVGAWMAADARAPLQVSFSEGSSIELSPGARMRVTETMSDGAAVLVERGAVRANIAHRGSSTRWSLRAGPFEVRVTGTQFLAAWDPDAETFELDMKEGSVVVSGPLLPPGRTVVGGERMRVSVREGRMELSANAQTALAPSAPPAAPEAPAPSDALESAAPAAPTASPAVVSPPASSSGDADPAGPPSGSSWRALVSAGKHREALAAAERAGFSRVVEEASSGELLTLADAARFAGKPARAKEALLAMRRRFGARGRTAFLLGKVAADQLGAPGEAIGWFETYLREEPSGSLAEQALGRVLELRRHGDREIAAETARRYLARFPNGAHAPLARSLLEP